MNALQRGVMFMFAFSIAAGVAFAPVYGEAPTHGIGVGILTFVIVALIAVGGAWVVGGTTEMRLVWEELTGMGEGEGRLR